MKSPVRSTILIIALAFGYVGCGNSEPEALDLVHQAVGPDQATPIGQKWKKLAAAGIELGDTTSAVQTIPGGAAQYQMFVNGVIVYSDDFGAVYITQTVFDKWLSLQTMTDAGGNNLFFVVGLPIQDVVAVAGRQQATFERGMVIVEPGPVARVVYGEIYLRYLTLTIALGLPRSEEASSSGGGRFQVFELGELHWRADLGAFAVSGPILTRWTALGGPGGALGFPKSDTSPVVNGNNDPIGLVGRFENGAIFSNSSSGGAHEIKGKFLTEYESRFGGPAGWLGFPLAPDGVSGAGDPFQDFQGGVLVSHGVGSDGSAVIYPFGELKFHLQRVVALGDDCTLCGAQDLFYFVDLSTSNGVVINHQRYPDSGPFCQGCDAHDANQDFDLNGVANSAFTVTASVDVWDDDDTSGDDHLGTPSETYSIDNLWGFLESSDHHSGNGFAQFNIKTPFPFDANDFRGQMFWSFENFKTPTLTYDQFSQTFADATPNEATLAHPFNKIYYGVAYKGVAKNGNCFGMSVESIYGQLGRSPYAEPIHQYFPDTQGGSELTKSDGAHASLYNEINVKQGYQLGVNMIGWTVAMFASGETHDPVGNYLASLAASVAGDYPSISIFDDFLFGGGHSVRPYRWDPPGACTRLDGALCAKIHIADSNHPTGESSVDDYIEIDILHNVYDYRDFHGSFWDGGRMFFQPFRLFSHTPYTPFADPWQLLEDGYLLVVGSTGKTKQITDAAGRTFFEPGLTATPTRWDQIRRDAASRIPNLTPVAMTDALTPTSTVQIYAGQGAGPTHSYDIVPSAGVAAGTPIETTFESGKLASYFSIPATPGKPDTITTHDIGEPSKAVSLTIPMDGVAKPIVWVISGHDKHRWAEFTGLGMSPGQTIRMHTSNAGSRVVIDNNGPATTATLSVSTGLGATPVTLGTVTMPSGSTTIAHQAPWTTLTLGNVNTGENGWLVAPVTITLATVDVSGVGIDAVEYSTDNVNWTKYSGPFQYASEGMTTLFYRARDKDLNQEVAKSQAFKIDTRLPATTGTVSTTAGVKLTYSVTDPAPGSGVAGLHVVQGTSTLVSSFVTPSSGTLLLAGTCSAVEFWGHDVAGNLSTHVKIGDSVAPVFTSLPIATITTTHCTAAAGLNLGNVQAVDDCGTVTVTNNAPAKFPLGTTIVTWTARDPAGHTVVTTQTVTTDLGDDPSCCPTGSNIIMGTSNNDILIGTPGNDCILGLGGQDTIRGMGGNDALSGGDGDDEIWGGDGDDWLAGGSGQDKLHGDDGNDVCSGGDGVDQIWGGNGNDLLLGGQGGDKLFGEAGNDRLEGGADDDTLDGGSGNDFLDGGPGHDILLGCGGGFDQCVRDPGDTISACTTVNP